MKTSLEQEDIQAIASAVFEMLKPLISGNGKQSSEDIIMDKKGLAAYVQVSESTINHLVSNNQIPFFKVQPGKSGGVRFSLKAIDKWVQRQTIPEITPII